MKNFPTKSRGQNDPLKKTNFQYERTVQMIGEKIKSLREEAGITREELAYQIGARASSVVNVEAGRENFSEKYIRRIADFFEIDPDTLFEIPRNRIHKSEGNIRIGSRIRSLRKRRK